MRYKVLYSRRKDDCRKQAGITLTELCISLTIITVIAALSVPSYHHLTQSSQATSAINWILGIVQYTRSAAIQFNVTTTLCPTINGDRCEGNWHQGSMVFTDHNADASINGRDRILRRFFFPEGIKGASLKWRAFRNRQYLQISPLGFTRYQNGNFTYCPASGDLRYARQIIINQQGRVRKAYDRNEDGIREDSRGRPLRCQTYLSTLSVSSASC